MKKIILLLVFVILVPTVWAQVNLDFALNIDHKIYFPNENVKVNISIINRDVSFTAKNADLTLTIADREYKFKLGDLTAYQTFSKEITLPQFPPGTHTIKGVLNYTGIFDETSTIETYNAFEVRFPEIERYPRNVNVIGFNLPDKMIAGKTYDVSVVVKNEGTVGGDMIIEVASLDESANEQAFLGPGESKTINLKVNFKNTEVSLIEARVYALINGQKYLLVYSGKKAYLEPERVAKLSFDKIEFVDESDNQINQNDDVKFKVYIKNTGNYPASSVIGLLNSGNEKIEVLNLNVNYNLIQNGQTIAASEPFVIKTKEIQPGQYSMTLEVGYQDSEKHTITLEIPLEASGGQEMCLKNEDCNNGENCMNNKCQKIECDCGEIIGGKCIKYGCCKDSDCNEFETCDSSIKKCVLKQSCVEVLNNGKPEDKINILFIGDGFDSYQDLKKKSQELLDQNNNGLFSVEPFKSNKGTFNIWMVMSPDFKHQPSSVQWRGESSFEPGESGQRFVASCPFVDYSVVISKTANYRSYAFFGGTAYLSLSGYESKMQGRLLLHEFGHSFGLLRDEYVEGTSNNPGLPNCASSKEQASQWWGDLAQLSNGVSFYDGCSYTSTNIRPTRNSIMRNHQDLSDDYGPVNKRALLTKISQSSGKTAGENSKFSSEYPIMFIHGWGGDTSTFSEMQNQFDKDKIAKNMFAITTRSTSDIICPDQNWDKSVSVNYEYYTNNNGLLSSEDAGIEEYGKRLSRAIKIVKYCTKSDKVILIAHSMGGLVARSYMLDFGMSDVHKLITLATPHYGAELGNGGKDSLEMEPDSEFLRNMNSMDCGNRQIIVPVAAENSKEYNDPSKKNTKFQDTCVINAKTGDYVVSEGSAKLKTDKQAYIVPCDHTGANGITNPKGCSQAYKIVTGELK